jgi:hypothetical protein
MVCPDVFGRKDRHPDNQEEDALENGEKETCDPQNDETPSQDE